MISQVLLGVNPVTDGKNYGIFIVPATNFATCFTDYQIGYYLDNQGYQATYYDEDNASGNLYSYTYKISATATNLQPIYFSVASYGGKIIPSICYASGSSSIVQIKVYSLLNDGTQTLVGSQYYYD